MLRILKRSGLSLVYVVYSFCVRMSYICSQACLQVSIYTTRYLSKLGVRRTKAYQLMICGGCSTNAAAANVRFSMLLLQTGLKFPPFLTREHCGSSKWACFLLIAEIEAVCVLDILFSSNHNIHKRSFSLSFWASDPLIERFYQNISIICTYIL